MNDLGPPPDWDGIFDRAHRRIAGRMLLVGAVGAFCALLLLGGGLSAQGAVSLGIGGASKPDNGHPVTKRKVKRKTKQHRKRARDARRKHAAKKIHRKPAKKKHAHSSKHHPTWNPCAGESLSSAEQQYCEGIEDGGGEPGAPVVPGPSGPVEPGGEPGGNQPTVPSK